jgi:hypothetical protein
MKARNREENPTLVVLVVTRKHHSGPMPKPERTLGRAIIISHVISNPTLMMMTQSASMALTQTKRLLVIMRLTIRAMMLSLMIP